MSRVLPILFNTEMVRAILDSRKTVTRRVIRGKIAINEAMDHKITFFPYKPRKDGVRSIKYFTMESFVEHEAPYHPEDILYVRETYYEDENCILYKSDNPGLTGYRSMDGKDIVIKWRPSIHMPKEAARIWLKVTDVGVERLQDITEEDVRKEGVKGYWAKPHENDVPFIGAEGKSCFTRREAFSQIWNSTLKKSDLNRYGWAANPWVWVIEFEWCEKPEIV